MDYKKWMISEEIKDNRYYQNIVLSKLGLNQQDLSKSVSTVDNIITKLNDLGEYKKLPLIKKIQIESQIKSKIGTIEDIIKFMAL